MNPGGRGMYGFSMRSFRRDDSVTEREARAGDVAAHRRLRCRPIAGSSPSSWSSSSSTR